MKSIHKYNKYNNKIKEIRHLILQKGGVHDNTLYLDFDETLGSFNVCYNMFFNCINRIFDGSETTKSVIIRRLLETYFLRPH